MYPRNAASPERIGLGAVVQISDGAVQTTGVSVTYRAQGGAEGAGGGTLAVGATSGVWYYTPTQGETNVTSFVIAAYKTGCIPIEKTVITSASATPGYAGLDFDKILSTQLVTLHSLTVTGATTLTGNVSLGGTLGVTGTTTFAVVNTGAIGTGTITTTGNLSVSGTTTLSGNVTMGGAAGLAVTNGITANITGNLSGSVGSVTGAVGSVTGAVGSVTGLTAADVNAIKVQTDKFVFTVANKLDVNVLYVNGVAVTGTGAVGDEWGP